MMHREEPDADPFMTSQAADIPWQVVRRIVCQWTGDDAELDSVTTLTGGSVSNTVALCLRDGRRAVLKITPHRVVHSHADEAWQLALLGQAGVPVPEVYLYNVGTLDDPYSYILMQYVDGVDLQQARALCTAEQFDSLQCELAEHVLKLHARTHSHFQKALGSDVQKFENWAECFQQIFDPIWTDVARSGTLPVKCRKLVGKIHDRLDRYLCQVDCPRLMHWDLWTGNIMAKADESGAWHIAALVDPMCRYGHVEAELAYLELFQTSTPAFMKAYQSDRKLAPEYHQVRKPIYQLYSLLNDLSLFGAAYLNLTLGAIEKVKHLA